MHINIDVIYICWGGICVVKCLICILWCNICLSMCVLPGVLLVSVLVKST